MSAGNPPYQPTESRGTVTVLRAALSLIPLGFVAYLVSLTGSGFDFTDEAAAINWVSDPFLYSLSHSQYGYFYHPAFLLAGGDIALLRAGNIVFTVAIGSLFGFLLLTERRIGEAAPDTGAALAASIAFGCTALLCLANWLITPNYNTLNLQGLLVTAIGLLAARRDGLSWTIAAFLLIGIGGWMTFMAKPSSALVLALAVGLYLLFRGSLRRGTTVLALAACTACLLLLVTAFAIDGSVIVFAERVMAGLQLVSITDPGHDLANLLRLDPFEPMAQERWLMLACAAATASLLLAGTSAGITRQLALFCAVATALAAMAGAAIRPDVLPADGWVLTYRLQLLSVPAGCLLAVALMTARGRARWPRPATAGLVLLFMALPYGAAFGTNNNLWSTAGSAMIFPVAAGLLLWRDCVANSAQTPALITSGFLPFALTTAILAIGLNHPYRQIQPVTAQEQRVSLLGGRTELAVDAGFADYILALQGIASDAGYREGDPLIDLTGHYAGASVALGGKSLGQSWMVGGYPGSQRRAVVALQLTPCKLLAQAWLLVEPGGDRALPLSVLDASGQTYEAAGMLTTAPGEYARRFRQVLMRPTAPAEPIAARCESARAGAPKAP